MSKAKQTAKSVSKKEDIVRSDLNLEKWNIFGTQRSRGQRVIKRVIPSMDGGTITQTVSIGLKGSSETLTAEDAKIFYLMLYHWDKNGRNPDGVIHGSFRSIFRDYKNYKGDDSSPNYGNYEKQWFRKKLQKLMSIPVVYENAYQEKDGTRRDVVSFTLIKNASLFTRKREFNPKQMYFDLSHFTIHEVIVNSILNQHVKPILLDVITKLKGELSVILYRHLDLIMADKAQFSRKLDEFQKDFEIGASRADNFLKQMRLACKELEGQNITTGRLESCRIERTEDGRQWKMVIKKGKRLEALPTPAVADAPEDDELELTRWLASADTATHQAVHALRDEIFKTTYSGMGGDFTKNIALLDAIRKYRAEH